MSAYLLGNLAGRFVLSYVIVWLALWITCASFGWRDAFRRTHHWPGLTAIATIFVLGLLLRATSRE